MIRGAALAVVLVTALAVDALAQGTVFLVRHAERADSGSTAGTGASPDPDLSASGRERAESLASMLRDAGVTAIYVTEFRRTQQTAAPLAKALGIEVTMVESGETARLVDQVGSATGNVLIVGHSNTVPDVLKRLGVATAVSIAESEYDNLFVVVRAPEPRMVRLRFR